MVAEGGFVGVDVFFVISGFLISGIIFQDLENGSFSFTSFYARRIRRIFPALLIVLTSTLFLGWMFLLPSEFGALGAHVISGAGFVSNLLLWHEIGYFNPASDSKPLLHLWSLGIEEQFYIFFPPLLVGLWRRKKNLIYAIVAIAVFSFILNAVGMRRDPTAVFYAPFTRIWEILIGAMLAYASIFRPNILQIVRSSSFISNSVSMGGIVFLLIAVLLLDRNKQFPGLWALLPTVGAFALIAAGSDAWFNRFVLSHRWVIFVGLVSYPLYLWHWTLLSFLYICAEGKPTVGMRGAVVLVAFLLAWLTFRYVEIPIRLRVWRWMNALRICYAIVLIAVSGLAIQLIKPQTRLDKSGELSAIAKAFDDWEYPSSADFILQGHVPGTVLLIGDSFLQHYYPRLKKLAETQPQAYSIRYAGAGGCPPLPDISRIANPEGCIPENNAAFALAMQPEVRRVVFGSAWHYFYPIAGSHKAMASKEFQSQAMLYAKGDVSQSPIRPGSPSFLSVFSQFGSIIARLVKAGKEVYIVLPTPIGDELDPHQMIDRIENRRIGGTGIPMADYVRDNAPLIEVLSKIAHESGAVLLNPTDELCGENYCGAFVGKDPIYKDIGHIRPYYAREYIRTFDPVVLAPVSIVKNQTKIQ